MFKWMNENLVYGVRLPLLFVALLLLVLAAPAMATGSKNHGNDADADARSDATAVAGAAAGAVAGSNAEGGAGGASDASASASNDGNSLDAGDNITNARTTFFSFNRSMPAAGKCFGTVDGGGGSDGGAGFLGINYLNKNCWYAALAGEEQNVEVKARLKCGSKHFRNAIAYDYPRKERQARCIRFMVDTYIEQLAFERAQLDDALAAQTILINDHVTRETERTSASTTRAVERCTDCFGEK